MRKEEIILSALTKDQEFTKKVITHISDEYFHDSSEKFAFKLIQDFYKKYEKLPSKDVLLMNLEEASDIPEDSFDDVKSIVKKSFTEEYEYEYQWLVDETEKFCQDKAVYNAIMQSVKIINGEAKKMVPGQIPGLLQQALSICFDRGIGHNYFDDADERFDYYESKESTIPFRIDLLNKVTNGGPPRRTLNMVVAQPKGGKSLVLCSLASDYIRDGYNVLYITLELAEKRVAERIDANLLNVDIRDVRKLGKSALTSKIQKINSKSHGKLIIKEYPTKSASAADFENLLDDLQNLQGFKPDVIIVDYLGITASAKYKGAGGAVNSYTYQKEVSEELRSMAVRYDLVVWTALQTNRSGYNTSDFDIDSISDSSGPIMTCDFAMGIIRTPELDEEQKCCLKQLASRYGDASYIKKFLVGLDKSRMKIYNLEGDAQTGIADESSEQTQKTRYKGTYKQQPSEDSVKTGKARVLSTDDWDIDE